MKTPIRSLAAVAALCALGVSAPAQTPLAFPNADFEADLDGWRVKETVPMTQASADAAHSGERGLRIEDNDPKEGSSAVSPRMDVEPGKRYRITFWGRTETPGAVAVYAWFYKRAAGEFIKQNAAPAVSINQRGGWSTYTLEVEPPEDAAFMALWIHSLGSGTGSADVDDFLVEEL